VTRKRIYDFWSRGLACRIADRTSYVLWKKLYTGGPMARLRCLWHHLICGCRYEICGECGRPVGVVWLAPDALWLTVVGHEGGTLCVPCFDAQLQQQDVAVTWVPRIGA
jgi:hypothetical protein